MDGFVSTFPIGLASWTHEVDTRRGYDVSFVSYMLLPVYSFDISVSA
jgi:hypothetical protein